MINLGFWQLRRLHERRRTTRRSGPTSRSPHSPSRTSCSPGEPASVGHDLNFRRVTTTGTYDTSNEIIVRARSLERGRRASGSLTPAAAGRRHRRDRAARLPAVAGHARPGAGRRRAAVGRGDRSPVSCRRPRRRGVFGATDPADGRLDDHGPRRRRAHREAVARIRSSRRTCNCRRSSRRSQALTPRGPARAGARRGPALQLRRPVVHLHDDRHRRVSLDPAPQGAGQGARRRRPADRR